MNHSIYNKQREYTLYHNGHVVVNNLDDVIYFVKRGVPLEKIHIKEITPDVKKYNLHLPRNKKLTQEVAQTDIQPLWSIPEFYTNLNVYEFVEKKFIEMVCNDSNLNERDIEIRAQRILEEYNLFKDCGHIDVLRLVIYIVDTFSRNNNIWGIGRGSSVSSYILYVIGLHDVDSVEYDLQITDFIKESNI